VITALPYRRIVLVVALLSAVHGSVAAQRVRGPFPPPTQPYLELGGCPGEPAQYHRCALEKAKTFNPPRTPDGKPDFQGFWSRAGVFGTDNIEEHGPELGDPGGKSQVVDPPDGLVPYLPWAVDRPRSNMTTYIDPAALCYPSGSPKQAYVAGAHQVVQTPDAVIFLTEFAHFFRIVPITTRPHIPNSVRLGMGDSRGRWEGNTLVVEVTNLSDLTWFDHAGNFYSDNVHVVERWTMIDINAIHYQATITDPKVYSRPWTMAFGWRRNTEPGFEFFENACVEGQQGRMPGEDIGLKRYPGVTFPR
jgi:hypothetical protein